jgi:hypothetical protein
MTATRDTFEMELRLVVAISVVWWWCSMARMSPFGAAAYT